MLFDSCLLTVDIFHDELSGKAAIELRRVDRFDYELTDVMNWDTNSEDPLVLHMVGVSKLTQ
jgi:hypothetical protein